MSAAVMELAGRYGAAWAARDADAIVSMHTEDSVFHLHDVAPAGVGRGEVRAMIVTQLERVPDVTFTPRRVFFGEDHFVSEYDMSGTAGGTAFSCHGVDVFSLRGGLIARKDTYIDWLTFRAQVGEEVWAQWLAEDLSGDRASPTV